MSAPAPSRTVASSGQLWWWLPRISILLFITAIFALFWYIERSDSEEKRATLIGDMLWLEQNLRFMLEHNEELLSRFDPQRVVQREGFQAYAAPLITSNSGVIQALWLTPGGVMRDAYPPVPREISTAGAAMQKLVGPISRAVYGAPYPVAADWQFDVLVPVYREGELAGIAVGVYSIRRLLADTVPWWIAERYRIAIVDQSSQVLGQRSNIAELATENAYQMPFDPPGHGLILHATPYRSVEPLTNRVIMAGLARLCNLFSVNFRGGVHDIWVTG